MTNCAKCGAELLGAKKFCIACGAPAVDPATLKRSDASGVQGPPSRPPAQLPQINVPPASSYGPPSIVNPFAATASPSSRAVSSQYGPPPAPAAPVPPPPPTTAQPPSGIAGDGTGPQPLGQHGPQVSPLAVSNALSQRGAFQQVADSISGEALKKKGGTSPPPPPAGQQQPQQAQRAPGTALMPSVQNPSAPGAPRPGSSPPSAMSGAQKRPDRTQLMDASSFARPKLPGAAPSSQPGALSGAAPIPTPNQPASIAQPSIGQPSMQQPPQPSVQYPSGQPPMMQPQQPPPPQQPWGGQQGGGWAPQAPSFGFAPGARVNVTWSNGQRYPATVSQVSGTKVLVVFPDGQQHWVEMQYLSPA